MYFLYLLDMIDFIFTYTHISYNQAFLAACYRKPIETEKYRKIKNL